MNWYQIHFLTMMKIFLHKNLICVWQAIRNRTFKDQPTTFLEVALCFLRSKKYFDVWYLHKTSPWNFLLNDIKMKKKFCLRQSMNKTKKNVIVILSNFFSIHSQISVCVFKQQKANNQYTWTHFSKKKVISILKQTI